MRLTLSWNSHAAVTYSGLTSWHKLARYAVPNEPSLHWGGSAPLPGALPPAQSDSPEAMLLLSSERFCEGDHSRAPDTPLNLGDSYQSALSIARPNSTRFSPPVLPITTA